MIPIKNSVKPKSIVPISGPGSQSIQSFENSENGIQIPGFVIETVVAENEYRDVHLSEYIRRVLRHKILVIIVTLLSMLIPVLYILNIPKVYQAEAKIQVDSENAAGLNPMKASATTYDSRAYYNTQLQLLGNAKLIRSIIKSNNLDTNKAFLDKEFLDPEVIASRFSSSSNQDRRRGAATGDSEERDEIAESERLNPLVEAIQNSLDVQPILQAKQVVKDTRLISLKFKHPNPGIAKLVSNAMADELVAINLDSQSEANSSEQKYLADNIADLKSQIRSAEDRILQFGRKYQLPTEDGNQNTVVERLVGLNRQLLEAENERKIAEAKYKASRAPGVMEALSESGAKDIAEIDSKIDDLQQKRSQLLVEVTEKYPEVQEIDKQIAVLKNAARRKRQRTTSNYKTGLEVSYRQAVAREKSIRDSYNRQWAKTLNQNGAAINYRIIHQELETNRKLLDEMQRREKESEMLTAKAPNNIRVIERALTPAQPINQNRSIYLVLAFLAAFSLGIGSALVRDYFVESADRTGSGDEMETSPTPLQIAREAELAGNVIDKTPRVEHAKPVSVIEDVKAKSLLFENGEELLLNGDSQSILAEALHQLQTVLQLSPGVRNTRTLLITSSEKGTGQTATLVDIAKNLAKTGASVLIVDADFRDPGIHKLFSCRNEPGLSNLLTEQVYKKNLPEFLIKVSENLHFLPSGRVPYNCSGCLRSNRMKELMKTLDNNFDFVLIDSPPVLFFADSSVLAKIVDGVLLTVDESNNSIEKLKQTRNFLSMAGANIIGVIWNKAEDGGESQDLDS